MGTLNGVHHIAIQTKNIKAQLEFFTDVLGAELKALYWMHGVENTLHGFVRLADSSYVAFEYNLDDRDKADALRRPDEVPPRVGGGMAHLAFNVDTAEEQLAIRDRLRDRGVPVFGPLDHGMCRSIYFGGPEDLMLEVATSAAPLDERAWIDPEVVALAGITDEELAHMTAPAPFASRGGAVAQATLDPTKGVPFISAPYVFERLVAMSDDEIRKLSRPEPPVEVEA